MRVLALFILTITAVSAVPSNSQRIVGGTTTEISQYPSIAALLFASDGITFNHFCGGIIINPRNILTAAHCLIDYIPSQWRTRVGSTWSNSGGVVHNSELFRLHPQYNVGTYNNNDIALIRTATTIVYNSNVVAGTIAGTNYNLADNQVVWAAGWGSIYFGGPFSAQLRHVQVWTINQQICAQRYGSGITENMLCSGWLDVGGRDQCQGDSGGPLYHNGVLVGVTSWGAGCADPFFPGINARVSRYTTWIQANVPL